MRFRIALVLMFLYLPIPHVVAAEAFSFKVDPHFGSSPQDVRVTTKIEPSDANQSVCVVLDGEMYRSACWQLDGRSPRTVETWLKGIRGGTYEVSVIVTRIEGGKVVRVVKSDRICIQGTIAEAGVECSVAPTAEN